MQKSRRTKDPKKAKRKGTSEMFSRRLMAVTRGSAVDTMTNRKTVCQRKMEKDLFLDKGWTYTYFYIVLYRNTVLMPSDALCV